MKLEGFDAFANLDKPEDIARFLQIMGKNLGAILNGGLIFHDNFRGQELDVTFPTANADLSISHKLGYMPTGYLLTRASVAMRLYDGSRPFTRDTIYLKSDAAGTASIIIF